MGGGGTGAVAAAVAARAAIARVLAAAGGPVAAAEALSLLAAVARGESAPFPSSASSPSSPFSKASTPPRFHGSGPHPKAAALGRLLASCAAPLPAAPPALYATHFVVLEVALFGLVLIVGALEVRPFIYE